MDNLNIIPVGDEPQQIEFKHFPTKHQAVIWRNWNMVSPAKLAKILQCGEDDVVASGNQMGLVRDDALLQRWAERGFQTIIRRNWELLDYEQLLELLEWTPEQLAFTLKEDDFFFHKLGLHKPKCEKVKFRTLTENEQKRTAEIRKTVEAVKATLPPVEDVPFGFLDKYGKMEPTPSDGRHDFKFNFIYAYSALYGDALMDDELASYPEAMFADYAASGVEGVWMQGVLYTLVPWLGEDQACSLNWQKRLANLKKLAKRAGKYGIRIYLYMNEPRSMPAEFFEKHPEWRGVAGDQDDFALCTSAPGVLDALSAGVESLFREVPELGGIFSITMSENLTHCRSRWKCCPRCEEHSEAELIAGINKALLSGIRRAGSDARVIAYTWAWDKEWIEDITRLMGPDMPVVAVSESKLPTNVLGYESCVEDYSISKVGPSEKTLETWRIARRQGNGCAAKVQINASWELSAVPYIPVPDLVEKHLNRLKEAGVDGLMLSWTLGGSPGGNLPLLNCSREKLADFWFGKAAQDVLKAWTIFSDAFEKYFPFNHTNILYFAPQNFGPASLLYATPSGRRATMIGFPYDDIDTWRGAVGNVAASATPNPMPRDLLRDAFRCLANEWEKGLQVLRNCSANLTAREKKYFNELLTIAEACHCHFLSSADQCDYVLARDASQSTNDFIKRERNTAICLMGLMRKDSRIGYEASNHYYYTENDLLEKVLNCDWLLQ